MKKVIPTAKAIRPAPTRKLPVAPRKDTQRTGVWPGSWATLRDLEVLLTVIEQRKTTAAALKLGVSQPAISRALSVLEDKAGRVLFRHEGTAILPTADALALYEEIQPIFQSLNRLKNFQWAQTKPTTLKIATAPSLAQCFLERLTASFILENPEILVSMEIATTPEVLELVADQRADVGIADVMAPGSGLQRSGFRKSTMVCVLPAQHPLAKRKTIRPSDLHGEPLVMLAKRNPMRPVLDRLFNKEACTPRVVMETTTAISAVHFAAQGVGLTLVNPFPVGLAIPKEAVVRHFSADIPYETSFFTAGTGVPSAAAQRYMEFVRSRQPKDFFMSQAIV